MSYISYMRGLVGHAKIFLAFASVVLRDQAGRILLQRRADFDVWGLPGGCLELGEDILSCARRELLEESGMTAGPLRLVGIYSEPAYDTVYPNGDQVQQYTVCFEGCLKDGKLTADGVETRRVLVFSLRTRLPQPGCPFTTRLCLSVLCAAALPHFRLPLPCQPRSTRSAICAHVSVMCHI